MIKIKMMLATLFALLLVAVAAPAMAEDEWVDDGEVSPRGTVALGFWHGEDWGKINADRTIATPRDRECDGNPVLLHINNGAFRDKLIYDENNCIKGGGTGTVPTWATQARFCEQTDDQYLLLDCTGWSAASAW